MIKKRERKYVITTGTQKFLVLAHDSQEAIALAADYIYKKWSNIKLFKSKRNSPKKDECIGIIPGELPLKATMLAE